MGSGRYLCSARNRGPGRADLPRQPAQLADSAKRPVYTLNPVHFVVKPRTLGVSISHTYGRSATTRAWKSWYRLYRAVGSRVIDAWVRSLSTAAFRYPGALLGVPVVLIWLVRYWRGTPTWGS